MKCANCKGLGIITVEVKLTNGDTFKRPRECPICRGLEWEWDERAGTWITQTQDRGQMLSAYIEDETPTVELWVRSSTTGWDHTATYELDEQDSVEAAKDAVADWIGGSVW